MDILSCNQERPLGFVLATEVPEIKSDQDHGSHEMSVALASFTCAYPSDIVTLRTLQRHCKLNPVSQPLVSFVYSILRLAASSRHASMLWQSHMSARWTAQTVIKEVTRPHHMTRAVVSTIVHFRQTAYLKSYNHRIRSIDRASASVAIKAEELPDIRTTMNNESTRVSITTEMLRIVGANWIFLLF